MRISRSLRKAQGSLPNMEQPSVEPVTPIESVKPFPFRVINEDSGVFRMDILVDGPDRPLQATRWYKFEQD